MSLESLMNIDIGTAIGTVRSLTYTMLSAVSNGSEADPAITALDIENKVKSRLDDTFWLLPLVSEPMDSTRSLYDVESSYAATTNHFSMDSEDDYWSVTPIPDVESETMTTQEAEVELKDIQYATSLGSLTELDYSGRKRFAVWCMFNSWHRELFQVMHAVTSEVDYSRVV